MPVKLCLFGRWLIGGPAPEALQPPPKDYVVRFETRLSNGTFHRFNSHMSGRAHAHRFAGAIRLDYALGDGSAYPIAIIGVRWKGGARNA